MYEHELNFLILVVIYNKDPLESTTIRCLINSIHDIHHSKIIIWDNSENMPSAESIDKLRKYWLDLEYYHTPINLSLSQIYNRIIAKIKDNSTNLATRYKFLLLFDQDSIFNNHYFTILKNSIKKCANIMLFVPRVISNNICVSPANLFCFKGFYIRKRINGLIKSNHKTAINSGMAISTKYLKSYYGGYNEMLTFYGIDDYFMIKYAKFQQYLYVIDYDMHHELAKYSVEDISMARWRHSNTIDAIRVILTEFNLLVRLIGHIYIYYLQGKFLILHPFVSSHSPKR